jgi:hypothetical protein
MQEAFKDLPTPVSTSFLDGSVVSIPSMVFGANGLVHSDTAGGRGSSDFNTGLQLLDNDLSATDRNTIHREDFCHIQELSYDVYSSLESLAAAHGSIDPSLCPPKEVFKAFVELYFEFFDKSFPCIHVQQLQDSDASALLLLAVASVGGQYSALTKKTVYLKWLQNLLHFVLASKVSMISYFCRPD